MPLKRIRRFFRDHVLTMVTIILLTLIGLVLANAVYGMTQKQVVYRDSYETCWYWNGLTTCYRNSDQAEICRYSSSAYNGYACGPEARPGGGA